jgi:hypothetical protein
MTPREMNFFWAGGPMSFLRYMTLFSFRKHNPDWKMRLWTCPVNTNRHWPTWEKLDSQDYTGDGNEEMVSGLGVEKETVELPIFNLSPNHASDLCKYKIVGERGGWFCDMDILFCRPMLDFHADVVLGYTDRTLGVGILAGAANNVVWNNVYQRALFNYKATDYLSCSISAVEDEYPKSSYTSMKHRHPEVDIKLLPIKTVYPFNFDEPDKLWGPVCEPIPAETCGVHWFGGHPSSEAMNNRLTAENFRDYPCTITRVLGENA